MLNRFTLLAALVLVTASCKKPEPPTIVPKEAKVTAVGPAGVTMQVKVDAVNPNSYPLTAQSITARAKLDGKVRPRRGDGPGIDHDPAVDTDRDHRLDDDALGGSPDDGRADGHAASDSPTPSRAARRSAASTSTSTCPLRRPGPSRGTRSSAPPRRGFRTFSSGNRHLSQPGWKTLTASVAALADRA